MQPLFIANYITTKNPAVLNTQTAGGNKTKTNLQKLIEQGCTGRMGYLFRPVGLATL